MPGKIKINKIIEKSNITGIEVLHNVDLRRLLTYRINGKLSNLMIVESEEALKNLLGILIDNDSEYFILGGGSNSLINDKNENIVFIKLGRYFDNINFYPDGLIVCGAAYNLGQFIITCYKNCYDFSFLAGIPGTVGGAVAGNSGTKLKSVCEFVEGIECMRLKAGKVLYERYELKKNDFGYRFLNIKNLLIITKVYLRKEISDKEIIFNNILEKIKLKKKSQPLNKYTAGCFFKNPINSSKTAAELIDYLGLKGFTYGGAVISKKHANFIENFKDASAKDIFELSRIIYGMVKDNFNIELENEVRLVGF